MQRKKFYGELTTNFHQKCVFCIEDFTKLCLNAYISIFTYSFSNSKTGTSKIFIFPSDYNLKYYHP